MSDAASFGAVALGDGSITGATQTSLDRHQAAVVLTVTPPSGARWVEVSSAGLDAQVREHVDRPTLLVVALRQRDPNLVLTVAALERDGTVTSSVRIAPFIQDPLDCSTDIQSVGSGRPAAPTYMEHLDAYLAAPILPSCDE